MTPSEAFATELRAAEDRLRAMGLSGRSAYAALCRHLATRLGLPEHLRLDGPDAPPEAGLERIPLTAELDLFGLAYERFFADVFKGERGQFFTPRPLVELMADLARIRSGDRVVDPTCGSGSFLVAAHARGAEVDGIELDPELVALCRLNLALNGADPRAVMRADLFRDDIDGTWDVVLANPPFSVEVSDVAALWRCTLARGRKSATSDLLFIESAARLLKPGGRLVSVLPYSVLSNAAWADARRWMDEHFVRRAVVSLPEGTFRPFGGAASRACVIALQKRPARIEPWIAAVVRNPGWDPMRKNYKRTDPDDLALLRIAVREGTAPLAESSEDRWEPDRLHALDGIGLRVPTTTLGDLAPVRPGTVRPADGDAPWTEIDLGDIDKQTGEVTAARALPGSAFKGQKTAFEEGEILFGRMRPNLNNVAIARRPDPELPSKMCGSSEWARLRPPSEPYFALVAARSTFVRAQLRATGGQTRPRVDASDLPGVRVPDPGPRIRALIDALTGEDHALRMAARRRMDRVAALYEVFGRGEIGVEELASRLEALRR